MGFEVRQIPMSLAYYVAVTVDTFSANNRRDSSGCLVQYLDFFWSYELRSVSHSALPDLWCYSGFKYNPVLGRAM
jgi:hypothetical protein